MFNVSFTALKSLNLPRIDIEAYDPKSREDQRSYQRQSDVTQSDHRHNRSALMVPSNQSFHRQTLVALTHSAPQINGGDRRILDLTSDIEIILKTQFVRLSRGSNRSFHNNRGDGERFCKLA